MKVTFSVEYDTAWGQRLYISGSIPALGEWKETLAPCMAFVNNGVWRLELEIPDGITQIGYRYLVCSDCGDIIREWNKGHLLDLDAQVTSYRVHDSWLDVPSDLPFYSSAFTKAILSRPDSGQAISGSLKEGLVIQVLAPKVRKGQYVALAGNQSFMGNWQPERALRLNPSAFPVWSITLNEAEITFPLEYKFLICDESDGLPFYLWEEGGNRRIDYPFLPEESETVVISGLFFRYKDDVPFWKGAGTVIPLFSLRSRQSFGVGDLGDLYLLIDWAKVTGQSLIQLLPMNDTRMTNTWLDSYPYSAVSIYALHPMYIDLYRMGRLKSEERSRYYACRQQELNANDIVDYEAVVKIKLDYCREYVEQEGIYALLADEGYIRFYERNKHWLVSYAAYSYLRGLYNTADFSQWESFAVYEESSIARLCAPDNAAYPAIAFNYYLQYVLDKQFCGVTNYARGNGIALKGDLPIGVNRNSVEVWTEPDYFNLDGQSGAPPDDFSAYGQNWLFPTYRWDVMEKDNYTWWQKRFAKMNDYFDCFRIDHILGFFRMWEIPGDYVQGLCGHFNPALPLSVTEIEASGLRFDKKRFTSPRIHEMYLPDLFGEYREEVLGSYLAQSSSHHFVLKPFCDTQRKVEKMFAGRDDEKTARIRQGMYVIANETLFLEDPREDNMFHPRISAYMSYLYKELPDDERRVYDHLYDDFFYHRHNEFWKQQALKKLAPLVDSTQMLVCGEDLGMIPATVPEVMHQLQLLSLEIERMPKKFGVEFAGLSSLPYFSVCTTSTHDMSPLRNWWKEDEAKTQRYYNHVLGKEGDAPPECTEELATQIIANHLLSPSMLVIIPWQDWMAMDDGLKRADTESERINIPAQTNFFWRYRMHLTLEELFEAKSLNEKINSLIVLGGRSQG